MSTSRTTIFAAIRQALRTPRPHAHRTLPKPTTPDFQLWLPPVGATASEWLDQFRERCNVLKTRLELLPSLEAAAAVLGQIAHEEQWNRLAFHPDPRLQKLVELTQRPSLCLERPGAIAELADCAAGITLCESLIAQTGSVLVTSTTCGGRSLSVLPEHHVVLAWREQLVPDLTAAYRQLRQRHHPDYPSMISLITGPSRTGDIERILVLGAHGPKRLTILLLDAPE